MTKRPGRKSSRKVYCRFGCQRDPQPILPLRPVDPDRCAYWITVLVPSKPPESGR
jgi:hypothetical protein